MNSDVSRVVVRCFSPSGIPTTVVSCFTPIAIVNAVARVNPADSVKVCYEHFHERTCQHPRAVDGEFCFECWRIEREQQRSDRREALDAALRRGLIVRQLDTFWSTAGVILTRFGVRADAIFIEPYQSDPAYLANHLENREHGFGFETTIIGVSHHD